MERLTSENYYKFRHLSDSELDAIEAHWIEEDVKLKEANDAYNNRIINAKKQIKSILDELRVKSDRKMNNLFKDFPCTRFFYAYNYYFNSHTSFKILKPTYYSQTNIDSVYLPLNRPKVKSLKELVHYVNSVIQYNDEQRIKNDQKIVKSVEFCKANNISTDNMTADHIYAVANEAAKDKWCDENLPPDGTGVDISCCSECSIWVSGQKRCSCGNRRVGWTVEGNIIDGFYSYPEAY